MTLLIVRRFLLSTKEIAQYTLANTTVRGFVTALKFGRRECFSFLSNIESIGKSQDQFQLLGVHGHLLGYLT